MAKYRVRPNRRFGAFDQHGPGTIVELTEEEARPFDFKLEKVEEGQEGPLRPERVQELQNLMRGPSLYSATTGDILRAVADGYLDAQTIIDAATGLTQDASKEPDSEPESEPEPTDKPALGSASGFDFDDATISEVLAAVDAGDVTVEEALTAEHAGKNRVSLIQELERRQEG